MEGRKMVAALDVNRLCLLLDDALMLESKFQPRLQLPASKREAGQGEICMSYRDGSAQVLRCLKVWYELPPETFFIAINTMDRFLTKMKARPKHLSCIAISSFHLATIQTREGLTPSPFPSPHHLVPDPADLVVISQCKATASDVQRMATIIENKLSTNPLLTPITALHFLKLFVSGYLGVVSGDGQRSFLNMDALLSRLEIVVSAGCMSNYRPCEVALALFQVELENMARITRATSSKWMQVVLDLQAYCKIDDVSLQECQQRMMSILNRYNSQQQVTTKQRLVWKLSQRTMRRLRPTDRFSSSLEPIKEHRLLACNEESGDDWDSEMASDESCDSESVSDSDTDSESDSESLSSLLKGKIDVKALRRQDVHVVGEGKMAVYTLRRPECFPLGKRANFTAKCNPY